MRTRRSSEGYIYLDSDTYQTAILNIQLPHGIKLQTDDMVSRQIKRQKEKDKQMAIKRAQEEKFEKHRQKIEAAQKKR